MHKPLIRRVVVRTRRVGTPRVYSGTPGCVLQRRRWGTRVGDRVRFSLASVFLPDPHEVPASLSLDSEVEGTIIDFSDSGQVLRAFAVVEVVKKRSVIVPVEKLRLESDEDQSGKELA